VQIFATRRALMTAGAGLVALGVAIEIAQDALTTTRMMDAGDVIANTMGVLLGLATHFAPMRDVLARYDAR